MQRIKLLFIITKLELGGAQKQLLNLIAGLDQTRFQVFLFTAQEGLLVEEAQALAGLEVKKSKYLERPLHLFKDILAFFELRSFMKNRKIDIVHTHSSKAGILGRWAARSAGIRNIAHTVHGWSFHDYQGPVQKVFFIFLERITARFTSKLIVVCQCDKLRGLKEQIGREAQYAIITYGIKHEDFSWDKREAREMLGFSCEDTLVGMISCFKPQKSPQDFIHLADLSRDISAQIQFVLVGDGLLRREIEKLIRKSGLEEKVVLTGWRRDIPRLLAAFDILILTSLWEGLPIVILEAMAASLAVITTDTGGTREIVRDGENGFLVPRRDTSKMCQRLVLLLKDTALRQSMGLAAKNSIASSFHFDDLVRRHADLYYNFMAERISRAD